MVTTWRVSGGLLDAYSVPWAAAGRFTTRGHTASPGRGISDHERERVIAIFSKDRSEETGYIQAVH